MLTWIIGFAIIGMGVFYRIRDNREDRIEEEREAAAQARGAK